MCDARLLLRVGRASSFCVALLFAPSWARAGGAYFRADLGAVSERSAYTRNDATPPVRFLPSTTTFAKRTVTSIAVGPVVRADLGWAIRSDVVLALSGEAGYVNSLSDSGSFAGRLPQGWMRVGFGPSVLFRFAPRLTARLGCAYVLAPSIGAGNDLDSRGAADTFDLETLSGVDLHGGLAWDLVASTHVGFGPALRLDLARLSNGRSDGASTLTTASISLTIGVSFR